MLRETNILNNFTKLNKISFQWTPDIIGLHKVNTQSNFPSII